MPAENNSKVQVMQGRTFITSGVFLFHNYKYNPLDVSCKDVSCKDAYFS